MLRIIFLLICAVGFFQYTLRNRKILYELPFVEELDCRMIGEKMLQKGTGQVGDAERLSYNMRKRTIKSLSWAEYMAIEGFDINEKDCLHWTPLHYAVIHGDKEAVEILLNNGALVNARNKDLWRTPLHMAAEKGFYSIVKLLVASGADVCAVDKKRDTPMSLAIRNSRIRTARYLSRYSVSK